MSAVTHTVFSSRLSRCDSTPKQFEPQGLQALIKLGRGLTLTKRRGWVLPRLHAIALPWDSSCMFTCYHSHARPFVLLSSTCPMRRTVILAGRCHPRL